MDQEKPIRLCSLCQYPLTTWAEQKIGVHIACIHEQRFRVTKIRRPQYGNQLARDDNG